MFGYLQTSPRVQVEGVPPARLPSRLVRGRWGTLNGFQSGPAFPTVVLTKPTNSSHQSPREILRFHGWVGKTVLWRRQRSKASLTTILQKIRYFTYCIELCDGAQYQDEPSSKSTGVILRYSALVGPTLLSKKPKSLRHQHQRLNAEGKKQRLRNFLKFHIFSRFGNTTAFQTRITGAGSYGMASRYRRDFFPSVVTNYMNFTGSIQPFPPFG